MDRLKLVIKNLNEKRIELEILLKDSKDANNDKKDEIEPLIGEIK